MITHALGTFPVLRVACAAALGVACLAACNPFVTGCTDELGVRVTPAEPSIRPGESFTAAVELTSCGGRKRWTPPVTWESSDTTVVTVVPATGRVTGRAAGVATVTPVERRPNGDDRYVPVRVTVRP